MPALLPIFINNLVPVFLIAATGYLLSRWQGVDPRTLSQVSFYIFSPCLVFTLITGSNLAGNEILSVLLFTTLVTLLSGFVVWLLGRLLRLERCTLIAVLLTTMFVNGGNFGLPVILFAFGDQALAYGSLFFVTSALLTYSVGVIIASLGRASVKQAVLNLFRVPALYAMFAGFLFLQTGWQLPLPLARGIDLLSEAAIPAMLVLLGLQLAQANWRGNPLPLALASGARLVIGPLLALGLNLLFGFQGPAYQANMLQAGMPSAVLNTVLATEYQVEPALVTMIVFTSTLLSPLTLTPLLAFLGG